MNIISHSAKGTTWKKGHKYLYKKNGRYYYSKPKNSTEGNLYYDPDNPDDVYDFDGNLVSKDNLDMYSYYRHLRDEDNDTIDSIKKSKKGPLVTTFMGSNNEYKNYSDDRVFHTKVKKGKRWLSYSTTLNSTYKSLKVEGKNGSVTRKYVETNRIYEKGKIEQAYDKGKEWIKNRFSNKNKNKYKDGY